MVQLHSLAKWVAGGTGIALVAWLALDAVNCRGNGFTDIRLAQSLEAASGDAAGRASVSASAQWREQLLVLQQQLQQQQHELQQQQQQLQQQNQTLQQYGQTLHGHEDLLKPLLIKASLLSPTPHPPPSPSPSLPPSPPPPAATAPAPERNFSASNGGSSIGSSSTEASNGDGSSGKFDSSREETEFAERGALPTPDGKPWDRPVTLLNRETCNRTRLPFTEAFVINMDTEPAKYKHFLEHMRDICGFHGIRLSRHSGVLVTAALRGSAWVRHYIPGIDPRDRTRAGSLGSGLAHLFLWDRIAHSSACLGADGGDKYALVLEDDEMLRENFQEHAWDLMQQLSALPSAEKPDVVLLNALRPWGTNIGTVGPKKLPLLKVIKSSPTNRHDYIHPNGRHYNIWLAAYLIRCSSAPKLVEYGGQYPDVKQYNGVQPVFDVHVNDFLTDVNVPLTTFVIGETDAISLHVEGQDSRKKLDRQGPKLL